jgi:hypothetical protein
VIFRWRRSFLHRRVWPEPHGHRHGRRVATNGAQTDQVTHRTFMGPAGAEATIEISVAPASSGVTGNNLT